MSLRGREATVAISNVRDQIAAVAALLRNDKRDSLIYFCQRPMSLNRFSQRFARQFRLARVGLLRAIGDASTAIDQDAGE